MQVRLECTYCGHSWERSVYTKGVVAGLSCMVCNDSRLKAREINDAKVDTYQGCPPFPEKPPEKVEKEEPKVVSDDQSDFSWFFS